MDEFKLTPTPLRIHGVVIMYFIYAEDKENNVEYYTKTTDAAVAISKFNDAVNRGWDCTISDKPINIDDLDYVSLDE